MSEIVLSPTVIDLEVGGQEVGVTSESTEVSVDLEVTEISVDITDAPIEVLVENVTTEVVIDQTPVVVEMGGLTWVGGGGGSTTDEALARIEDVPTALLSYVGEAAPGADPADAVWRIKKVTDEATGVHIRWADSGEFTQVWDDRATYVYN